MIFITGNAHKLKEYQSAIPNITSQKIDLAEVQEATVEEISYAKAVEGFQALNQACFTEDVSFEIEVLGGFPGPYVKWFLKTNSEQHIAQIVEKLGNAKAIVKAVIGLKVDQESEPVILVGRVEGVIVHPRGESTFGFDNIFQPDGSTKTYGEMTSEEKNTYSHRGKAIQALQEYLNTHYA